MSDVKWTRGPWLKHGARIIGPHPKDDGRQRHIATAIHDKGTYREEREANANLIAAAPELYEALEIMTRWVNEGGHNGENESINDICKMGEQACAKARGEQ